MFVVVVVVVVVNISLTTKQSYAVNRKIYFFESSFLFLGAIKSKQR